MQPHLRCLLALPSAALLAACAAAVVLLAPMINAKSYVQVRVLTALIGVCWGTGVHVPACLGQRAALQFTALADPTHSLLYWLQLKNERLAAEGKTA